MEEGEKGWLSAHGFLSHSRLYNLLDDDLRLGEIYGVIQPNFYF